MQTLYFSRIWSKVAVAMAREVDSTIPIALHLDHGSTFRYPGSLSEKALFPHICVIFRKSMLAISTIWLGLIS
ncbi:hypothetical protein [Desulfogranum japonicum]|uniref:hypothetical protein n=1 Tax=Desulfogranum japonicum TaxID=231447 RepID=UPI000490B88C|nr:hypothetical protein [Desulfogranum japonicum]